MSERPLRHVLGISGGKDSAALAIFMRDRVPEMEYFFCDTQKELPETYEFLTRLEAFLRKPIARLNAEKGFDHWLKIFGGYLPSSKMRWCTRQLKIRPFEDWLGEDAAISYVAIRADEDREGYVSTKPNIRAVFPFKEQGINKEDVFRILQESGVGLPKYYEWRTRSGCYFCFFQRKGEWMGLRDRHPELFELAKTYEKPESGTGAGFTWSQGESLDEMERPERRMEIMRLHDLRLVEERRRRGDRTLAEVFANEAAFDDEDDTRPCQMCHM